LVNTVWLSAFEKYQDEIRQSPDLTDREKQEQLQRYKASLCGRFAITEEELEEITATVD
jgi:hypothetical protein